MTTWTKPYLVSGALIGGALVVTGIALLPSTTATAAPSASPSASGSQMVTTAGTSFLTATSVEFEQDIRMSASTGDYLYWSYEASAGQVAEISATVTLPEASDRQGAQTWSVEVFDGLRRRQACTSGAQTVTAEAADESVALGCVLSEVRSWAEPWSGDPLPGTYYVRLSAEELLEEDLGQTILVAMDITATDSGDPYPEGGELAADLVPAENAGSVAPSVEVAPSASESSESDWIPDLPDVGGWLPQASTRWIWTTIGGLLAGVFGIAGFRLTRRPRGRPVG